VTVEQVRTQAVPRSRALAPGRTPTTTVSSSRPTSEDGPLCLVVPEIADGEGTALVRSLRRRDSTRAVLLTRSAGRRDLVVLLGGGIRGAAREVGVLRLVADGRTNREIGEALSLSALTVKSHLARISRKVGTGDRAEMVAFAIRHELLR